MANIISDGVAVEHNDALVADEASVVPQLENDSARATELVDVGFCADEETRQQVVFAIAAAKRHDGTSFLADFATALLEYAVEAQGQLFQDVFAAFISGFRRDGFFVEVGTGDGKLISNTYLLEKRFGWAGLVVEPNPVFLPALRQNRACQISTDCVYDISGRSVRFMCTAEPEFSRIRNANADMHDAKRTKEYAEIELETVSLNDLLKRYHAPNVIDYLSLDVEGAEFDILQTFDFDEHRVSCISVEHNWSESRGAIYNLLTDNGFVRVFEHFSQWDDWYVQRDLLSQIPAAHSLLRLDDEDSDLLTAEQLVAWALEALQRSEPQVAEVLCLRALEIDSKNLAAQRTLAEIATIQGRRKLALARWQAAVENGPDDYWARFGLAELLAARGDIAGAVAHLNHAISLGESSPRASELLAKLAPKLIGR